MGSSEILNKFAVSWSPVKATRYNEYENLTYYYKEEEVITKAPRKLTANWSLARFTAH